MASPSFRLVYRGVDISGDLDPQTTSVTYTDNEHGEADEIEVTVQNSDDRWLNAWKPEKGDLMELTIFDGKGGSLPCGQFEMDEPEAGGRRSGDTMSIRGVAAPVSTELRTQKSRRFEEQNLSAIVGKVTGENGLSLEGAIRPMMFKQKAQRRERDLEFLTRLAEETGHYFSVRGTRAIFTTHESVDGQQASLTVHRNDGSLLDYSFREQSAETYTSATVSYLDPNKKETIKHEETDARVTTGDVLVIAGERVEDKSHAEELAKSRLHLKNRQMKTGNVEMVGTVQLVAGAPITVRGFGAYDDKFVVKTSTHSTSRSGYVCDAELVLAKS